MNDDEQQEDTLMHPMSSAFLDLARITHHASIICVRVQEELHNKREHIEAANRIASAATHTLLHDNAPRSVIIAAAASILASAAANLVGYEVTTGKTQHGTLEAMLAAFVIAAYQLIQSDTRQAMQLDELVGKNDANN